MRFIDRIQQRWATASVPVCAKVVINPDGSIDNRSSGECVQEFVDQAGDILKQIQDQTKG